MHARLCPILEQACAFKHNIHTQLTPGQLGWVTLGKHSKSVAVDHNIVAFHCYRARKATVRRIVLSQVRIGFRITQVVDGNHVKLGRAVQLVNGTQDVSTDSAVTVNRYFYSHDFL